MIQLQLSRIKIDENRNEQVIVLKEMNGNRFLPVVIGISEVNAIKMKLSGIQPPRPLTHDLLLNIIHGLGGQLKQVLIDRLENNTFFAKLVVARDGQGDALIDARPSDSIAVALRAEAPIFVEEDVLNQAGAAES